MGVKVWYCNTGGIFWKIGLTLSPCFKMDELGKKGERLLFISPMFLFLPFYFVIDLTLISLAPLTGLGAVRYIYSKRVTVSYGKSVTYIDGSRAFYHISLKFIGPQMNR